MVYNLLGQWYGCYYYHCPLGRNSMDDEMLVVVGALPQMVELEMVVEGKELA